LDFCESELKVSDIEEKIVLTSGDSSVQKVWGGQTGANQNCGGAILKPLTIRQFVAFTARLWFCTKLNNVFFHLYRDETKTCLNMPMIVSKHCLAKRIMVPDTVT